MPHADSSLIPKSIVTKAEFWEHIYIQLETLYEGQRVWVSNLANASSLIYHSLLAFPNFFGADERAVNWCGFYLLPAHFPGGSATTHASSKQLLLGPFCGKPACQFIRLASNRLLGVCADAFLQQTTVVVPDVQKYPGHIACDGDTKSEIVVPLVLYNDTGEGETLGVLDLDCLAMNGFNRDDKVGLEKIAALVVRSCDW